MRPKRKLRYIIERLDGYWWYDNKRWGNDSNYTKSASTYRRFKYFKQALKEMDKLPEGVAILERHGFKKTRVKNRRVVLKEWCNGKYPTNIRGELR